MIRQNLVDARGPKTQTEIARRCGVKQQTYSHWERGVATPPIKKMLLLEKVLGVPKEQLFPDVFNLDGESEDNKKQKVV